MADHEYRIIVVGAGGVGKSALTVRFIQGNFVEKYDPTIEDSYRKQVEIDAKACMLDIMDTAGQEEYSALRDQYMKSGQGFVLVYSITSKASFEQANKLRTSILRIKEEFPDIPIQLVANKCDLENERVVKAADAQTYAKDHKMGFIEASAKTNHNVSNVFTELVKRIDTWRTAHPEEVKKKRGRCTIV